MYNNTLCFAIIVAGGSGSRFGANMPKQFLLLGDKPVIAHSMISFENSPFIDQIILVAPRELWDFCHNLSKEFGISKLQAIAPNGKTRQDSVYNGLAGLNNSDALVLIHDAARPFVPQQNSHKNHDKLEELLEAAYAHKAATFAIPATETIKLADKNNLIKSTLHRDSAFIIQTPQAFCANTLIKAHKKAQETGFKAYDDCQLIENLGISPKIVIGSNDNIKITHAIDMVLAEEIYENRLKIF